MLSIFVASVEPSRPLQFSWVASFALAGLAAAAGCLWVAVAPKQLAASIFELRLLVACLMGLPFAGAAFLLLVTHSAEMVGVSLVIMAGTAFLFSACIWPAFLKRTECPEVRVR